eukprot:gene9891-18482_t
MVDQETQYEPPFNVDLAIADFPESPNNQDNYSASEKEDPEWLPENDEESDYEYEDTPYEQNPQSYHQERKFIVFESSLQQLLIRCNICSAPTTIEKKTTRGTMLIVKSICLEGHSSEWRSQLEHNKMPWGNFLLAASILFSGSQPAKVLTPLRHMNICSISERLYSLIQHAYLLPSKFKLWDQQKKLLLESVKNKVLTLGGDGRCDTPGHCAKYGSYTIMDLDTNKIVDTQLVQVSNKM